MSSQSAADLDFPSSLGVLSPLTESWVETFTNGKRKYDNTGRMPKAIAAPEARAWVLALPKKLSTGKSCRHLTKVEAKWRTELISAKEGGGLHGKALQATWALLRDGRDGHRGAGLALQNLHKVFIDLINSEEGRRPPGEAENEWIRMISTGVAKVRAESDITEEPIDPCNHANKSEAQIERALSYDRTDIGNSKRLADRYGSNIRYIRETGEWMYKDHHSLWHKDIGNVVITEYAMETVNSMKDETALYPQDPDGDPKKQKDYEAFVKFVKASANSARLKAMIDLAKAMPGIAVSSEQFDSNPRLIACKNGAIELTESGYRFRELKANDYCTINTGVDFNPQAISNSWDKFLDKSVPDQELRWWLQIALGYSIFGKNPERLFFIVQGPTRSGKTTLTECIYRAMGEYSDAFSLAMFRETQEERARPDLMQALPKRILFANEASAGWVLFADTIKRMTGGDRIQARQLFARHSASIAPAFTPWLLTNEYPTIRGIDTALLARIFSIPFPHTQPLNESDRNFTARLAEESKEAVLAWLVRGWKAYCDEGLRDMPHAVAEATMSMKSELSEFDMFLQETCRFGPEEYAIPSQLYEVYVMWMERNGTARDALSQTAFGRQLNARGYSKTRATIDGAQAWVRAGLRLKGTALNSA